MLYCVRQYIIIGVAAILLCTTTSSKITALGLYGSQAEKIEQLLSEVMEIEQDFEFLLSRPIASLTVPVLRAFVSTATKKLLTQEQVTNHLILIAKVREHVYNSIKRMSLLQKELKEIANNMYLGWFEWSTGIELLPIYGRIDHDVEVFQRLAIRIEELAIAEERALISLKDVKGLKAQYEASMQQAQMLLQLLANQTQLPAYRIKT